MKLRQNGNGLPSGHRGNGDCSPNGRILANESHVITSQSPMIIPSL